PIFLWPDTGLTAVIQRVRYRLCIFGFTPLGTGRPANVATRQTQRSFAAEYGVKCQVPVEVLSRSFVKQPLDQLCRVLGTRYVVRVCKAVHRLTREVGSKRVVPHTAVLTRCSRVLGSEAVRVQVWRVTVRSAESVQGLLQTRDHQIRAVTIQ